VVKEEKKREEAFRVKNEKDREYIFISLKKTFIEEEYLIFNPSIAFFYLIFSLSPFQKLKKY